jgi:hypothetical protein
MAQINQSVDRGRVDGAALLAARAAHAERMGRWQEAAGYWFAAASACKDQTRHVGYLRASEAASCRSLAGAA